MATQQDVTFLLEGLMPGDRRDFHNPMRGFLSHAAKTVPELPSQTEMHDLVEFSKSVSPKSQPSAWLDLLLSSWKNTPGMKPKGFSTEDLMGFLSQSLVAAVTPAEGRLQNAFRIGNFAEGRAPLVGAYKTSDKESAEKSVQAYQADFSPSTAVVLPLGGAADGGYLALAYHNEDVTTSHVFQALKFMGYCLDEQAEAQLEMYDEAVGVNEPHSLAGIAKDIAAKIPSSGVSVPLLDLHGLHSQPHRYDQEVLDMSDDVGIT